MDCLLYDRVVHELCECAVGVENEGVLVERRRVVLVGVPSCGKDVIEDITPTTMII